MRRVLLSSFAALAMLVPAGCDTQRLTNRELVLSARHVSVTVENRSSEPAGLLFTSDTLHGQRVILPGVTDTIRLEPEPRGPDRGPIPGPPERWSLVIGRAVIGPTGEMLGVAGPLQTVATSQAPFSVGMEGIFIRIDAAGVG